MKVYTLEQIHQMESPSELHGFMLHHNWDDGVEVPHTIIRNKNCDRGTALMIYWLAGPMYFYQYESRNEIQRAYEVEQYDLINEIERKYISGYYRNEKILFNPRYDSRNDGYDHTQTYDNFPRKRKIPDEMFEPSTPDLEWEAIGRPIKTIKKADYKELFKSLDDEISKLEVDEE